jgi:cytosine/adenosine deaminase-related metal-dependent hydrolase
MRVTLQHERNRRIVALGNTPQGKPFDMPVTVRQALEWATINGAKMANLDKRVGSLTPGKEADVLLLRASDINMQPIWEPVASVVMQGGVANVDTVLVAGKVVKRAGKLLYPQLAEKAKALRASGERILTDFGYLPQKAA